ncbi:MAG TPA: response regulator transcription factor [Gemmatimonadales bacterium]
MTVRQKGTHPLGVVLADDSEVVRQRLRTVISGLPDVLIVGEAADADQALARIREHAPDVVVLDMFMPGGGGTRVLQELAGADQRPIVLVFTNFAYPEYRDACLQLGADHFLDKSADLERLLSILGQLAQAS